MRRRVFLAWAAVVIVALILSWIALGHSGPSSHTQVRLIPFPDFGPMLGCLLSGCSRSNRAMLYLLVDILGNIVVFAPFGIALYIAVRCFDLSQWRSILVATALSMGLSLFYEIAQYWIPGRVVATDDVILNTLGSALGAWAASFLPIRSPETDSVSLDHHD